MTDQKTPPQPRSNALRWRDRPRLVDKSGEPPRPRGRHAKPSGDGDVDDAPRKASPVPIHQRLGYRPAEFAALTGVSYVTIWRRIKRGDIKTVEIGGVKLIPRAFAIEQGLITDSAV